MPFSMASARKSLVGASAGQAKIQMAWPATTNKMAIARKVCTYERNTATSGAARRSSRSSITRHRRRWRYLM